MFYSNPTHWIGRYRRAWLPGLLLGITVVLLVPNLAAPGSLANSSPVASSTVTASVANDSSSTFSASRASTAAHDVSASALAIDALSLAKNESIPNRLVYVPYDGPAPALVSQTGGHVAPTYSEAPAPLGIAYYGLSNASGMTEPTVLNTDSLAGTFRTNSSVGVQPEYLDDSAPDAYSLQLNAVLVNVTLNGSTHTGKTPNEFWTQNVVQYAAQLHELQFIDNVWSFWPGFEPDTILAHGPNGTYAYPEFYYGLGPTIHISYPFSLTLYLNSTVIDGDTAIYFNYTLSNDSMTESGSYDYVVFDSDGSAVAGGAQFQANGYRYDPVGLPNDYELVIGGPGGGSTTDLLASDASLSLQYWNATTRSYRSVPSAYNTGGETGETAVGANVWYSGTTAFLTTGPAISSGLWETGKGLNSKGGITEVHVHIRPSNAFLFLGPASAGGNLSAPPSSWQWAPLVGPSESSAGWLTGLLALAAGKYTVVVLESDFTPMVRTFTVSGGTDWLNVTLTANPAAGIYTPLFAWTNAQLAALSSSGAGTPADPYHLIDNLQPGQGLNPLFGTFNDYGFPTFAGLELLGTTASVTATPPAFTAPAPAWLNASADLLEIPNVLGLATWLIDSEHVAIVNDTMSGIWFPWNSGYADPADVMVFQSTHILIANNTFNEAGGTGLFVYDQGSYGAGTITIWGNTFVSQSVAGECDPFCFGLILPDTGLQLAADGDLVYNNYFSEDTNAWTPTVDWWALIYAYPVVYTDRWNVTPQAASHVRYASGFPWFPLSGSITHTSDQGGNFWNNYGYPADPFDVLPFNDSGLITVGGDYDPLLNSPLYSVTLNISILPNDPWVVMVQSGPGYGWTFNGTGSGSVHFVFPNGDYWVDGYIVEPGTDTLYQGSDVAYATFSVNNTSASATIVFPPDYLVLFEPYGFEANDTAWGICLTNPYTWRMPSPWSSSGGILSAALSNGTWNFTSYVIDWSVESISGPGCASVPEMQVTVALPVGSINVSGAPEVIPVEFNETFPVTVRTAGMPDGAVWLLQEPPYPAARGTAGYAKVLHFINGTYREPYASRTLGYLPYEGGRWGNVTFVVNGAPTTVRLHFHTGIQVTFEEEGIPADRGYLWGVRFDATNYSTYETSLDAYALNGTFRYTVAPVVGYSGYPTYVAADPQGVVVVDGSALTVVVQFVQTFAITFSESGLPTGTSWTVDVNGHNYRSTGTTISLLLPNGSYVYLVRTVEGLLPHPAAGSFTIHGTTYARSIVFSRPLELTGATGPVTAPLERTRGPNRPVSSVGA